jgi:tRNA (cytosine49-C5)-methyltransferase
MKRTLAQPKVMENTSKIKFKQAFKERYGTLTDWNEFRKYSLSFLRKTIRVNTLKISKKECVKRIEKKGWTLTQVPWCAEGFWIEHPTRRDVGNLWEHHLGYIYVQEAASMIPPLVLKPKPHEAVLDIAASPGSKTTQMAAMMKNTGVLVANDYKGIRLAALGVNVQRVGATNTIVTHSHGQKIKNVQFDRILVDAPCSGTGTICKSLKTIDIWNPAMVRRLHKTQLQLLKNAWKLLKPGGTLVYSTCTLEPEENEGTIHAFLNEHNNAIVDIIKQSELPELKRSPAVMDFDDTTYNSKVQNCLRIWPQDNYTEGFFVTRIIKEK